MNIRWKPNGAPRLAKNPRWIPIAKGLYVRKGELEYVSGVMERREANRRYIEEETAPPKKVAKLVAV